MRGFTIIELIVVLGIGLLLVALAAPIYGNLQNTSQVNAEVDQLVQTLRLTRDKSVAGLGGVAHGIFFETNATNPDRYIIYRGASYAARDQSFDRVVVLPAVIKLTTTLPGTEINFVVASGTPSVIGEITLTHETYGAKSVAVNTVGLVELLQ